MDENQPTPFKITKLKYTKYHFMSGLVSNGSPLSTSIEFAPIFPTNRYHIVVRHTYYDEATSDTRYLRRETDLPDPSALLSELSKHDLRDLKNNYFTDQMPQKFQHWELEYNSYFKISGTFDQEPDAIRQIVEILHIEDEINQSFEEVKNQLNAAS